MKTFVVNQTGLILVLVLCLTFGSSVAQSVDDEQALIEYYVQAAREDFQRLDMRQDSRPFELLLLTRRFTIDSNGDTLQLDTALIRASYRRPGIIRASADTLFPDTFEVFQSSFLEERPSLPALFIPPPWQEKLRYYLYPNDPGIGNIALGFSAILPAGDTSRARAGLFLVDRSSGRLTYLLQNGLDVNGNSRSAEYVFIEQNGALMPQKVVEHMMSGSVARSGYYIVETYLLDVSLK